jgi:hypothetical protein
MGDGTEPDVAQRICYVVDRLVTEYGYPVNGAAGIVGNLIAESAVMTNRIEGSKESTPMQAPDFGGTIVTFTAEQIRDRDEAAKRGPRKPGIGLAQWTAAGRRAGLFKHSYLGRVLGVEILFDMDAQVDYLDHEMRNSFKGVSKVVHDPTVALHDACDEVLFNFETPGAVLDAAKKQLPRSDPRVQQAFKVRRSLADRALREYQASPKSKGDDDMPIRTATCVDTMGRGWFFFLDAKGQAFARLEGTTFPLPPSVIVGELTAVASTVKPSGAAHGPIDIYGRGLDKRIWTTHNDSKSFSPWKPVSDEP